MDIGKNLGYIFGGVINLFLTFFVVSLILAIMFIVQLFKDKEIKSKTLITPKIELVTDGEKVDTIYIYKQP